MLHSRSSSEKISISHVWYSFAVVLDPSIAHPQVGVWSSSKNMPVGRVVVYGGKGSLGSVCVSILKSAGYWVCSVDLVLNNEAHSNVLVSGNTLEVQESTVLAGVHDALGDAGPLDAILNVAGGWAGGAAGSADFIKNCDLTWRQSVWTSVVSASLAAHLLKPGGLLVLPGARPGVGATPGMQGYGMAKAAVHQLTQSLGCDNGGLPEGSCTLAILPVTLDTAMNRKWMADADKSTWTPLELLAEKLMEWTGGNFYV